MLRFYDHVRVDSSTPVLSVVTAISVPTNTSLLTSCAHVMYTSILFEVSTLVSIGRELALFGGGVLNASVYLERGLFHIVTQ